MAAEKGYLEAIINLAILYVKEKNIEKGKKWYLIASEKGDTEAIYNIGLLYQIEEK